MEGSLAFMGLLAGAVIWVRPYRVQWERGQPSAGSD
jgi:hypothetical protein